jgi:hypothetical protein
MKFGVTPGYRDVYKVEAPDINTLISDIPSRVIVQILASASAELYFSDNHNGKDTQAKIFSFFSQRFTDEQKNEMFQNILSFLERDAIFFTLWYITEFIQRELANFRDFDFTDTNPEQEYRLLQAYFIIVEQCNDSHIGFFKEKTVPKGFPTELRYQWATWPMLASQFSFNYKVDPIYQVAKTLVLLRYLENKNETKKYVQNFLGHIKRESILHYLYDLLSFVNHSFSYDEKEYFKPFILTIADEFRVIFDEWCIDPACLTPDKQVDYKGMRERPLYKTLDGRYLVLNWSFMYNQLNLGLLFSFHNISGVKEKWRTFPDFRSHISKSVSEQIFFSGIINKALKKKYTATFSSDNSSLPDCYHREHKYIFLIEFKDVLMPSIASSSNNFETIKADIDTKFIESKDGKKGIRQILQQINMLNQKTFEEDDFVLRGYKRRNMVVYPVIVFSHFMYSMPGINTYLNSVFKNELKEADNKSTIEFREIKDLVMIDLEYLYRNFVKIRNGNLSFKTLLDSYIDGQKKAKIKAGQVPSTTNIMNVHSSFEEIHSFASRGDDFSKELFDALNIVV